jgi:hypothetical protein
VAADRPVLPTMLLQTTKLMPFGMLTKPTRHFFSDGARPAAALPLFKPVVLAQTQDV